MLIAPLSDAAGRPVHADFGSLAFSGWKQLSAPLVAEGGAIRPPVRLRDLAITKVATTGVLGLSSLEVDGNVLESFAEFANSSGGARVFMPGLWYSTDPTNGSYAEAWPTTSRPCTPSWVTSSFSTAILSSPRSRTSSISGRGRTRSGCERRKAARMPRWRR